MRILRPILALALALPVLDATAASAAEPDHGGWQWTVAPYIWGTGMDGKIGIGPVSVEVEQSFGDIVSHLDLGGMLRVEGEGRRVGVAIDFGYVNLSETTKLGDAEVTSEQFNAEVDAIIKVNEHFSALVGARFWKLNNDIDFANPALSDVDAERDWTDPVVGFIARTPLADRWDFRFRGDVGGFGGGSDLTWQAELLFAFEMTERSSVVFGYRALEVDFDSGSGAREFIYDVAQRGLEVGFAFHF